MTDSDLLQSTSRAEALAQLVSRWAPLIYQACLRQTGDPARAELATGAAFLILAQSFDRVLGRYRWVGPWLYATARAACRNQRAIETPSMASADLSIGPAAYRAPTDWSHLAQHLDDAMASLPADCHDAIVLKYFANFPINEVAEHLRTSKPAAGQRISAGVARLRRYLDSVNHFVAPDALVAAIQSRAVAPPPPHIVPNVLQLLALSPEQQGPSGDLASRIQKRRQFQRLVGLGITCASAALMITAILGLRSMIRNRPGIASNGPTPPSAVASNPNTTHQQSPQNIAATRAVDPGPAVKPVRDVDPAHARRLIEAIRQGNFDGMLRVIEMDEGLVNAKDPGTGKFAVQVAAELVDWRRAESQRIAHWLIDHGAATDIHTAARAGHVNQVLRCLVRDSRSAAAKDSAGLTPLQRAILNDGATPECEAVADVLLQAGASLDIWSACTLCRVGDVQQLLGAVPQLAKQRCQGAAPLHWAVRPRKYGDESLQIVRLLLASGAELTAADDSAEGMTPLHHAAAWGDQVDLVKFLLEQGVSVNVEDDFGWTPLDYALDRARNQVAELLAQKGGKRTTRDWPDQPTKTGRFLACVRAGDAAQVKILLDDTPDLARSRGPTGQTPLHHAAANGSIAVIDMLLADKAPIDAHESNRLGGTPLHWAVRHGQITAVKHLLARGADPKQLNQRTGQSLLHVAAQYTDDPAMVELILSRGLDPTIRDRKRRTAADVARQHGHSRVLLRLPS